MNWISALSQPARYLRQIERLHKKHASRSTLYELRQADVPLATLHRERRAYARRLAREVTRGGYVFGPVELRAVLLDRVRTLYAFGLQDALLSGVLTELLLEAQQRCGIGARVFSYWAGRSHHEALRELSVYLRRHRRAHRDPRQRGLFVLRRDVSRYGDSIGVDDAAVLWRQLEELVAQSGGREQPCELTMALLRQAARPPRLVDGAGEPVAHPGGVPIGSPISTSLLNLHLKDLDQQLMGFERAFYARYGDDLVFAHADAEVARRAAETIDEGLARLGLRANAEKAETFFFNGAGRPSAAWPQLSGTAELTFVGHTLAFSGGVAPKRARVEAFVAALEGRVVRAARVLVDETVEVRAEALCAIVNAALDPRDARALPLAGPLLAGCTDRHKLKQLDYRIARLVARGACGDASPRALRLLPWGRMREEWGLCSLTQLRNLRGRV